MTFNGESSDRPPRPAEPGAVEEPEPSPGDARRRLLRQRLKQALERGGGGADGGPGGALPQRADRSRAPLSAAQERLWFLERLIPGTPLYNICRALILEGPLDTGALAAAWAAVTVRHEALRMAVANPGDDGEAASSHPHLVVAERVEAALPRIDLRALAPDRRRDEGRRLSRREARTPFDLTRPPLFRVTLVSLADERHRLLFTVHHLVFDGWSLGILLRDLGRWYGRALAGGRLTVASAPRFGDFTAREATREDGEEDATAKAVEWWRRRLAGLEPAELPTDRPRGTERSLRAGHLAVALPAELVGRLRALGGDHGASLFTVLLAGWQALISRYTGQARVAVGSPVANRGRAETEAMVGFFVNTLVLDVDLSGDPTGAEALERTRDRVLDALAQGGAPFARVVEALAPGRSLSHSPLFQTSLVLQNAPLGDVALPGIEVASVDVVHRGTSEQDLILSLEEAADGGLEGSLLYDSALLDAATARRTLGHWRRLLEGLAAAPEAPLADLDLLSAGERHRLLVEWNRSPAPVHRHIDLASLLRATVARHGGQVALAADGLEMDYAELGVRAEALARRLARAGLGPGSRVGLYLDRSPEAVLAIAGVALAGAAYVPLSPDYPLERLAWLLDDAAPQLVLAHPDLARDARDHLGPWLRGAGRDLWSVDLALPLDEAAREAAAGGPLAAPAADDLAYVLYTSGSTGTPKGVGVTHGGVARLVAEPAYATGPDDVWLHLAPLSFDASALEIWIPLATGGRLEVLPAGPPSLESLATAVAERGVTALFLTAALFHQMVDSQPRALVGLRLLMSGGDVLSAPHMEAALAALSPGPAQGGAPRQTPRVIDAYGPTENACVTTCQVFRPGDPVPVPVPIGRPIVATRVYVVDRHGRPLPENVAGEVWTSGAGLARGYLGRPGRTAAAFVPHPFAGHHGVPAGARAYRTGDLGRWQAGRLDFVGRSDQQVKVRGFRIEPGEIESCLADHPGVGSAAVAVLGQGVEDKRLVAVVSPAEAGGSPPPGEELRGWLDRRLPPHMVPSGFVAVDALPRTRHDKVDRRELARIAGEAPADGADAAATPPRGPLEERLAALYADLLQIPDGVGDGNGGDGNGVAIGREGHFFHLGGHSLLATRLVSRLRSDLGVEVPVRRVFESPTVARLATVVEELRGGGEDGGEGRHEVGQRAERGGGEEAPPSPALVPVPRDGDPPASFAQARLWFLDRLDPGRPTYNMPAALELTGDLVPGALAAALAALAARHETLRTVLPAVGGEPRQRIRPPASVPLPVIDLAALPAPCRGREAARLGRDEGRRPFDLAAGPLARFRLLRLGPGGHRLLFTLHHAISDGWSTGILVGELAELYAAAVAGRPPALAPLPVQYADYAAWERRRLSGERLEAQLDHWRRHLAGVPVLELPTDRPRPAVAGQRGRRFRASLGQDLSAAVRGFAAERGATPFMVLSAAFAALLGRTSGQRDLAVGTPAAGRDRVELEGLIGFFVNTLALRADLGGGGFGDLVDRFRETTLAGRAHQDVPFERLVEDLVPDRDLSRTPLFQAMFILQNAFGADAGSAHAGGIDVELVPVEATTSKFEITLALEDAGGGDGTVPDYRGWWVYRTDLFDATTVRRMAGHFRVLLTAALESPDAPLDHLPLLTAGEWQQAMVEWNVPRVHYPGPEDFPYPGADLLPALFARQVVARPEEAALELGGDTLSYGELARRAAAVARGLRARGVGPDVRVGIAAERGFDLVAGLLGVVLAGGAYVPLDPGLPAERLEHMVRDSRARLVLTGGGSLDRLPELGDVRRLDLGELAVGGEAEEPAAALAALPVPHRRSAAYVIYTSGSTGRPKGVVVDHGALGNRLRFAAAADLRPGDAFLHKTTISFDVSVLEIFGPLVSGGRVVMARPGGEADPGYLARLIAEAGITEASFPPTLLEALLESAEPRQLASLRTVVTGGETVPADLPGHFYGRLGEGRPGESADRAHLLNRYGPTEATVSVTSWRCPPGVEERVLPIGRPTAKARLHLLDRSGGPVPVGVTGEIHVGGPPVARGYLGRPAKTAEVFVPDPFAARPGARLYKTGDLGRLRTDGAVEFAGRVDRQVKVRGYRIELGEVEAALRAHPGLREVAVVDLPDGASRRLAAYLVVEDAAADTAQDAAALRAHLGRRLPDHMVPASFTFLDALPLSPTGKVDRKALAEIEAERPHSEYQAPRTAAETWVAGVFAELLPGGGGAQRVGRTDDFFALGGHSLLATKLVSRLGELSGVELPLRRVFEDPTVEALARALDEAKAGAAGPALRRRRDSGVVPLSFGQRRLWFLDRLDPGQTTYNIPVALRLEGNLDGALLHRALAVLVRRHDQMRAVFTTPADADPVVEVLAPGEVAAAPGFLTRIDLSRLDPRRREVETGRLLRAAADRPFDLARAPLWRFLLLARRPAGDVFAFVVHHVVSDGTSVSIFLRELEAVLGALGAGAGVAAADLPELPVRYADHAAWQRRWFASGELERQLDYWRRHLAGLPALELPTDRPRPALRRTDGARHRALLPAPLGDELAALARRRAATPFAAGLALFQAFLVRYAGQRDFAVGTPVEGRDRAEVENVIGFFVNTLALRTDFAAMAGEGGGAPGAGELVAATRRTLRAAQAHAGLPFEKLVEELEPIRDLSTTPIYQVMFTHWESSASPGELAGMAVELLPPPVGAAKVDLNLQLTTLPGGGLEMAWGYPSDLFDATTVRRMAGHFRVLLTAALESPDTPLDHLPMLTAGQWQQAMVEWNVPRVRYPGPEDFPYPGAELLPGLFARQVAARPEEVALELAGDTLSYGGLARRAAAVARGLRARGVGPEVRVGIAAERGFDLVAGILGIVLAGGAYVPLDPGLPGERLEHMVRDSRARLVLTGDRGLDRLPELGDVPRLDLGELAAGGEAEEPAAALAALPVPHRRSAAYVLYTSGSTGRPKGVVVDHAALGNRLRFAVAAGLHPGDAYLHKTTISFDVSVLEIFGPLVSGGRVVMARPGGEADPGYLARLIAEAGITEASFPPALLEVLLESAEPHQLTSLRTVVSGGETMPADLPGRLYEMLAYDRLGEGAGRVELFNRYGPTETTVAVTSWRCRPGVKERVLPIGRPTAEARIHLLDRSGRPVPVGVTGEIHVGGPPVSRGYLGRPAKTAEVFVPDPFATAPCARLYKTGDLGRLRTDGAVEFVGRVDRQVKVRGYRIELGEVEAALRTHPGLREVAVVDLPDGASRRLAAYLVAEDAAAQGAAAQDAAALRAHLGRRLPDHMVPASFTFLDALPRSPTGKVDRKALAEIEPERPRSEHQAPRTATETWVAGAFAELLPGGAHRVGRTDDFFALGGHSLLATKLVARLGKLSGVELPLRRIFETPTVEALARALDEAGRRASGGGDLAPLEGGPGRRAPVSFGQRRLWFLDRLVLGSPTYNLPLTVHGDGALEPGLLRAALAALVRRHDQMRCVVPAPGDQPVQVVLPAAEASGRRGLCAVVDLSALDPARGEAEAGRVAQDDARRPFDLARGPLWRFRLLQRGGSPGAPRRSLLVNAHRVVSDGASLSIFLRDLDAVLTALAAGDGAAAELPELALRYADHAARQRQRFADGELGRQLEYWRRRLAGLPALDLPADRPRPSLPSPRARQVRVTLPAPRGEALEATAREHGVTPFAAALALFQAFLARHSGQRDFAVGTPLAGRGRPEVEDVIGPFVNTLVLRADLGAADGGPAAGPGTGPSTGELVRRAAGALADARAHADLPFEKLVEELVSQRDPATPPLFQVLFTYGDDLPGPRALAGLPARVERRPTGSVEVDLGVHWAATADGGLATTWSGRADLFDATTLERMGRQLGVLLEAAARDPRRPVVRLALLTAAERQQALVEWNDPPVEPADRRAVTAADLAPALFLRRVESWPERVALELDGEEMTYGELARRAACVARELRRRGVGPEVRVGIAAERSFGLVAGLLGIVFAGGAYVPLDPALPPERLTFMVRDAGLALILTGEGGADRLPGGAAAIAGAQRLPLAEVWDGGDGVAGQDGGAAALGSLPAPGPRSAAYVIYTSGSTGTPKGVVVPHAALAQRLRYARAADCLPGERFLFMASASFDVSVLEVFAPLVAGGTAVIARPGGQRDPGYLVSLIASRNIVRASLPVSLLEAAMELPGFADLTSLTSVLTGSEVVPASLPARFHRRLPGVELVNRYGPTEATISVTSWTCRRGRDGAALPIGRPIAGARVYLLGRAGALVPAGGVGELHVGGPQVSRGYLGRPAKTAEAFIPDPFATAPGGRLYRTGDLARHRADGTLEFIGRVDRQVKVRGYRIELGEVEAALRAHPAVGRAAVIDLPDGPSRRLAAFVVGDGDRAGEPPALDAAVLRGFLAAAVPEHMVPASFTFLDKLPLTASDKVDHRALAALASRSRGTGSDAPRTLEEELLADLFAEVLGRRRVGVEEDFFELGGDSLLAVRLCSRLAAASGRGVALSAVFRAPTVRRLAALMAVEAEAAGPLRRLAGEGMAGTPLILVHPGGGGLIAYAPLLHRLKGLDEAGSRPVWGLRDPALDGAPTRHTMEALAQRYHRALGEVFGARPIHLAGWSLGGLVAYEIARLREREGHPPVSLTLIDAVVWEGAAPEPGASPRLPARLGSFARHVRAALGDLGLEADDFTGLSAGEALKRFGRRARERDLLTGWSDLELARRWAVFNAHIDALEVYRPAPFGGRPLVLEATEVAAERARSGEAWRRRLGERARVEAVAGDHFSLVRGAGTGRVARLLAAEMAAGDGRGEAGGGGREEVPVSCAPEADGTGPREVTAIPPGNQVVETT